MLTKRFWVFTGAHLLVANTMVTKKKIKKRKKGGEQKENTKTPILDTVIRYAIAKRTTYPKLSKSLRALEQFVGADELKESLAKTLQYLIMVRTPKQKRRSKRRRAESEDTEELEQVESNQESEWESDESDESDQVERAEAAKVMLQCLLNSLIRSDNDDSDSDYEEKRPPSKKKDVELPHLHTMLMGPPGTGKTSFAHILAKIWQALGFVDNDTFLVTRRSDWIGKYQGHSCARARKLIAKAKGGIIFIDEAYALVMDKRGDDMYGNEVMTEIVEAMNNPEKNVTFIMAGYENEMKRLFMANAGLRRRFDFMYTFKKPGPTQLMQIFTQQVRNTGWKIKRGQREEMLQFFTANINKFENAGGTTEQLVRQAKQAVVTKSFPVRAKYVISVQDMREGMITLEKVCGHSSVPNYIKHMYI